MILIMVSSDEKNYKNFIVYKDDNYKFTPLHIMLLKTTTYVKRSNGKTKWINFLIKDDDHFKNMVM